MAGRVDPIDLDLSWQDHSACLGLNPDLFFPERGDNGREAKKVCAVCTVRDSCLEYAIRARFHEGIYGGMTSRDRKRLITRRLRAGTL